MKAAVENPTQSVLEALREEKFDFFTGVADSLVGPIIHHLETDPQAGYIPAAREDLAIGLAAGAYLGGKRPVVLMQNSGLGYCFNALTSLNLIYDIPVLLLVGYRGFGGNDAPEHLVMGRVCEEMLKAVQIPYQVPESNGAGQAIRWAAEQMKQTKKPVAVLFKKGVLVS